MSRPNVPGTRILDRLVQERRISQMQHQDAVMHAQRTGIRAEEGILAVRAMTEMDLLKYAASLYKTQFVTTEKLARASVNKVTLDKVPLKVCEKLFIFPVLFDPLKNVLSVVAPSVEDDLQKQVQMSTNVREVKVYVGRAAAIEAAIAFHYKRDRAAFGRVENYNGGNSGLHSFGNEETGNLSGSLGGGGSFIGNIPSVHSSPAISMPPVAGPGTGRHIQPAPPPAPTPGPTIPGFGIPGMAPSAPTSGVHATPPSWPPGNDPARSAPPGPKVDILEILNVMVALIENGREDLRGHSSLVARLCKKLLERVGVPAHEIEPIQIAAYIHDVGKPSIMHLTALNVHEYTGHREQAQKTFQTPLRLLEAAKLPDATKSALTQLYERHSGGGFPDRLSGKDISLGARVLGIVETYADLTSNAKNAYRKVLTSSEACDVLDLYKDKLFDPNLVDLFRHVVLGDDLRKRLLADRRNVLLVDDDPEETTVLELRFIDRGSEVTVARSVDQARDSLGRIDFDLVVSEVELGASDGFALLKWMREQPKSKDTPVVFLTRRTDRDSVNRGFESGAADYLIKPASADVVVAKAFLLMDNDGRRPKKARGVSGSIREMALPDVIQVLYHGRKRGCLEIKTNGRQGNIHFVEGQIHAASFGSLNGEEAVYALLSVQDGEFSLDPLSPPPTRTINESAESLLLEGMRRMDEQIR